MVTTQALCLSVHHEKMDEKMFFAVDEACVFLERVARVTRFSHIYLSDTPRGGRI